jgi:hypothetical protein
LPTSFREYAVYCYKTNNTSALFSKYIYSFLISFIEGIFKMVGHVCVEFGKHYGKLGCLRKRRERSSSLNSIVKLNESRKPIWMVSGLAFKNSNPGGLENRYSSGLKFNKTPSKENTNTNNTETTR